jgi:hypothetical protein
MLEGVLVHLEMCFVLVILLYYSVHIGLIALKNRISFVKFVIRNLFRDAVIFYFIIRNYLLVPPSIS